MTEKVTVEKKVYEVLQKNNLELMDKLEKAKKALNKILKESKVWKEKSGFSEYARRVCQNVLKEIEG